MPSPERPYDNNYLLGIEAVAPRVRPIPTSPIEALMQARPGDEPVESYPEILPKLDRVVAAVEQLDERSRWVVEATIWRGLSMDQLGRELGLAKSTIHRIYHNALDELREHLTDGGTDQ